MRELCVALRHGCTLLHSFCTSLLGQLNVDYGRMITYVKQTEPLVMQGGDTSRIDLGTMEHLLRSFHDTWKQGIESIHRDVVKSFPNLTVGMDVLKQVLTQMLLYYTRFLDLVKEAFPNGAPFAQVLHAALRSTLPSGVATTMLPAARLRCGPACPRAARRPATKHRRRLPSAVHPLDLDPHERDQELLAQLLRAPPAGSLWVRRLGRHTVRESLRRDVTVGRQLEKVMCVNVNSIGRGSNNLS